MNVSKQINDDNLVILRLLGISGVLGGILLFFGDQLLYWGPVSNLSSLSTIATGQVPIETLALGSDWRLEATATLGLISAWLYTIGAGLFLFAFKPAGKKIAITSFILFAMVTIAIGIEHTMYYAIGIGAKNAYIFGAGYKDSIEATRIAIEVFNLNALITYIPAIVFTVLVIYTILTKKTHLPKWFIVFLPGFLINSQYLVLPLLPNNMLKVIIMGGYVNASMAIFFLVFTIVMWNGGKETSGLTTSNNS
jgi:Family of unknown function (DUF6796)